MARIRTVKPEFWTSPDVAALSRDARLLFIGTWTLADDHGYLLDDPARLLLELYPGDRDIDESDVREWIAELATRGMLRRVRDTEGRVVLQVVNFRRHQRIDRPSRSRFELADGGEPVVESKPERAAKSGPARRPRARKVKVDPATLPDDFPAALEPYVDPVLEILTEIAEGNGARAAVLLSLIHI